MPTGYRTPRSLRWQFFDLVCAGRSLAGAERELGVSRNVGAPWWGKAGGMKLREGRGGGGLIVTVDWERPGGRGHRLSYDERVTIMRLRDKGCKQAEIARQLKRDPATVSRELQRNANADGDYHAGMAHARAAEKAQRPKEFKLKDNGLCAAIESWMDDGWSPKLIAEMLARDYGDAKLMRVSHGLVKITV